MPNGDAVTGLQGIANTIKQSAGSGNIDVIDAGDVEIVRMGEDLIATLPKGKDVFFINRTKFPTGGTDIKQISKSRLSEAVPM